MKQPEFGYIEADINHWLSILVFIIIPLIMLLTVCYFFNKKRILIKENKQSKWQLAPLILAAFLLLLITAGEFFVYKVTISYPIKPVCLHFHPDIVGSGGSVSESILPFKEIIGLNPIYNFNPEKIHRSEWPFCPHDKETLEAYMKDHPHWWGSKKTDQK